MKIAYILCPWAVVSNRSNGIRSQAETWAKILIERGHSVDFIDVWKNYDWKDYDVIHLFGGGDWVSMVSRLMYSVNKRIVYSPIYDYSEMEKSGRIKNFMRAIVYKKRYSERFLNVSMVLARSMGEKLMLQSNFHIPAEKIQIVPLSYSYLYENETVDMSGKEKICFHISSIYQERKNVIRLVEAAKKYNFELYLAGNRGTEQQFSILKNHIGDSKNIHVLGFVSEEQKLEYYKKAKVFALPSLCEGVGIVALDAAVLGCEIVVTNIPGPKEYYNGMAKEVSPCNIEQIGKSIVEFLDGKNNMQPRLSAYIKMNYSPKEIGSLLEKSYLEVLNVEF